ncbi:MAG: BTAD domain-containing putative transcriptional regulator [Acidiferrobacteraceae bacterium]
MRTTAFPAKVSPPKPSRVLARTRLFRRLDSAQKEGIAWVAGPPGSGKTILVSSYLRARRRPFLWYQIDAGDADPATFFHYLTLAAHRANRRSRRALPILAPVYLPGLATFTRRFFESLSALLKPSCLCVFDNLHDLPEGSPMLEMLPLGFDALGSGTGVIICSRAEPPAALARLLVHRQLSIIDGADMAMTRTETQGVARLRRVTLTSSALEQLHTETHGWAAGLTLLMDDPSRRRLRPDAPNSQTGQALFDYFAREIFDTMPPAARDVLLATAFVPKVTAGMAQVLSGNPQAHAVLADLTRRNYFTMVHPGQEDTYRYHRLFRTFLRTRAKELLTPAEIDEIRTRAAMLLEQAGEIESAATLLRDARNWAALASLCERKAETLLGQGRAQTLISWIMMLPEPFREQSPWPLYWLAVAQQPLDPARHHFARAFTLFRAEDNARGQFLSWAGIAHCYYLVWDEYGSSDYWLTTFDELRERYPDFPSADIEPHVVSGLVALLVFRQPYHRAIDTWAARLASLIENTDNPDQRIRISSPLLTYYLWTGNLRSGGMLIDLLRGASRSPRVTIPDRMIFMLLDAAYSWHVGNFAYCLDVVTEARELSRSSGFCILDGRMGAQGLYARLALEDTKGCIPILRAAETMLTPERRLDVSHYHHQASWFHLVTGDPGRAEHHGRKALALANKSGCVFPRALCHLFLGFVQIERGFFQDAGGHIRAGQQIGRAMRSQVLIYTGLLAEAYSALQQGNEDAASRALTEAFVLGREHHYISAWGAWQRRVMTRLCGFALARGIETGYVVSLIRTRGFVPEDSSVTLDRWPWPVKLYTFGHFRIEIDGALLRSGGKGQIRPLELLKLLIASGGRMVPERQLSAILWPHTDGDSSHQSFATTLHRLRRLLRHDSAVLLEEGRVSLNPDTVWLDVWAFERLGDMRRGPDNGPAMRHDSAENLLALYQGDFLAAEDAPWVLVPRERLRARFLRQHRHVGEGLERSDQWADAIEWYQRGMEVEPLEEESYRGLIRCHRELKHYSAALAAYHRCEQLLVELLGRPPNAETQRLYREILKTSD